MRLSDEALAAFRAIWEEEHPGETTSDEELRDMAIRVLRLVDALCHPIPIGASFPILDDAGDGQRPLRS